MNPRLSFVRRRLPGAPAPLARRTLLSRRGWLLGTLASGAWACEAGNIASSSAAAPPAAAQAAAPAHGSPTQPPSAQPPATPAAAAAPPAPAAAAGGLSVVRLGSLREDEKGGQLVVLLHGWRARGDDLVSLARELAGRRRRFLVPAGPLPQPGGGRAWWSIDKERPAHTWVDELPKGFKPNLQVAAARSAVQALLRDAQQRYAPDSIAVVGFSQGAQLALDVGLAGDPLVDRVAVLSGVVLADSLPALRAPHARLPAVFVSHGRSDPVLPFHGGESIQSVLQPHGYAVTFVPFEGGHEIPASVVERLRSFLAQGER